MRRALIVSTLALALVLVAGALASAVAAKPPPGKGPGGDGPPVSGTIYAGSQQGFWEIAADGSSYRRLGCGGDLSHNAVDLADTTDKLFLSTRYTGVDDPHGSELQRPFIALFADAVDGSCIVREVFMDFPETPVNGWDEASIHLNALRWSPDDGAVVMLVWYSAVEDPRYVYGTYDVWLADAEPYGLTIRLTNMRDLTDEFDGANAFPYSWSSDGSWITYWRSDPSPSVYVVEVASGHEYLVAPDAFHAAFSPLDGDYRIVFLRNAGAVQMVRYLWTGTFDPANPGPLGAITQVTFRKNGSVEAAANPTWSPDGEYFAFSATGLGLGNDSADLYRVPTNGKGKLVRINDFAADFWGAAPMWRADP